MYSGLGYCSHLKKKSFFKIYLAALDPSCSVQGTWCVMRDLWLQCPDSPVVAHQLSCSAAAGILVPCPGIKPASSALQGRFFPLDHPGRPPDLEVLALDAWTSPLSVLCALLLLSDLTECIFPPYRCCSWPSDLLWPTELWQT